MPFMCDITGAFIVLSYLDDFWLQFPLPLLPSQNNTEAFSLHCSGRYHQRLTRRVIVGLLVSVYRRRGVQLVSLSELLPFSLVALGELTVISRVVVTGYAEESGKEPK